jgi:hypothetical protein
MLLNLLLWACDAPIKDDTSSSPTLMEQIEESPIHWAENECSYNGGDHICNLSLTNSNGDVEEIYNYYGEVIVLDISAMWCDPCQIAAWNSNSIKVTTGGVKWITVLIEDLQGNAPDEDDGIEWGNYFGIEYNEIWLGTREDNLDADGATGVPLGGWPYFLIIDKDLRIRVVQEGWNKDEIIAQIESLKAE